MRALAHLRSRPGTGASLVFAVLGRAACLRAQTDGVLIHGARVIDGTGAPACAVSVRIHGGRMDVGTGIAAPTGGRVVEAGGQTLIPGLFDLHTHIARAIRMPRRFRRPRSGKPRRCPWIP